MKMVNLPCRSDLGREKVTSSKPASIATKVAPTGDCVIFYETFRSELELYSRYLTIANNGSVADQVIETGRRAAITH